MPNDSGASNNLPDSTLLYGAIISGVSWAEALGTRDA
jgi:hypothetical protein